MKKFLKIFMAIIMVLPISLCFVACGEEEEEVKKTLSRTIVEEETSSIVSTASSINDVRNYDSGLKYKVGLIKSSDDMFYSVLLGGGNYGVSSSTAGRINWEFISQWEDDNDHSKGTLFNYYEDGQYSSYINSFNTVNLTSYFPLTLPNADLTTISNDPALAESQSIKNEIFQYHQLLNQHFYFTNAEYVKNWKLTSTKIQIVDIGANEVSYNDLSTQTKTDGIYDFLEKPMKLMYDGTVNVYEFSHIDKFGNFDGEKVIIYVDATYNVCLGADTLVNVRYTDPTTKVTTEKTYYNPEYRVYLNVYEA